MFKFNDTSLDDLFEPYRNGNIISNTNLILDGVDIANRYQAYNGQTKVAATGYKINGTDLSDLLAKKGTEVLGRLYKSYTTPGSYTFTPMSNVEKYFVVVVGAGGGGGGGGGNSGDDEDGGAGGGGGGAGAIWYGYLTTFIPISITIGTGGYGGQGGQNKNASAGGNGGNTVFGSITAIGGSGGGGGRRSDENHVFGASGYTSSYGAGGRGGDGGTSYNPLSANGQNNYSRPDQSITLSHGTMVINYNSPSMPGGTAGNVGLKPVNIYYSCFVAPGGGGGAGENGYSSGGAGGRGRDGMSPEGGGGGAAGGNGSTGAGGGGGGAAGGHTDKRNGMNGGSGGNGAVYIYY